MIIWKPCEKRDRHGRYLSGRLKRLFSLGLLILMCCSCAAASQGKGSGTAVTPAEKAGLFNRPRADALVMQEGISWLGLSDKPADYVKARENFQILTQSYPDSEWHPHAEKFIQMIDALQSAQAEMQSALAKSRADQKLAEKMSEDNMQLKKEIHTLNSKCQTERAGLVQENEQLKKDIELLKKLEVQLDRREKMLR